MPTRFLWVAPFVATWALSRGVHATEEPPSNPPLGTPETSIDSADAPREVEAPGDEEDEGLASVEPSIDETNADEPSIDEPSTAKPEVSTEPIPVAPLSRKVLGDQATGFAKRTIGPLGLMTFNGPEGTHGGGALHVRGVALLYGPVVSARYLESHWIGYDTFGTTYSLSAQMGIGGRWDFSPNHGPFIRADVRGETTRMGGFRYSSLRLPGLQLGYGLDQGKWMLDAFGHAGLSLTGRILHPGFTRRVRGAFVGGAFSLGYDNWLLHSDVSHLLHSEGPFWDVRSSLCSYWGRKPTLLARTRRVAENVGPRSTDYSVGFCTDFGSLNFPFDDEIVQKMELGLSIVFGTFSRLDHAGRP
jgi:hypothetical protein